MLLLLLLLLLMLLPLLLLPLLLLLLLCGGARSWLALRSAWLSLALFGPGFGPHLVPVLSNSLTLETVAKAGHARLRPGAQE